MAKKRRYFTLTNAKKQIIGHGIYYPAGGNVQVFMKPHNQAWQFASIVEALLLNGVHSLSWVLNV